VAQTCHEFAWKFRVSGDLKFHLKTALHYTSCEGIADFKLSRWFIVDIDSAFSHCALWMWAMLLTLWMYTYMLLLMSTELSFTLFSFTIKMGAVDTSEKSTTLAICT
jgi:hypothetical protein